MKEIKINKIMLVSLCDDWTVSVATQLSQNLGMLFCNIKDLVEYELMDKKIIQEICSTDYLLERERKVIEHYLSFENVVSSVDSDFLLHNKKLNDSSNYTIFLNVPKTFLSEKDEAVNLISYADRTKKMKQICDAYINIRKTNMDFVCERIIEKLREVL